MISFRSSHTHPCACLFSPCRRLRKEVRYADLLHQLSPDLHGRVLLHTYGKWLSVVPFFNMRTDNLAPAELYAAELEFKGCG